MNPYHQTAREVQKYLDRLFAPEDAALRQIKMAGEAEGLAPIEVTPLIGKTLCLLAKMIRAERILEIGTLGGYSTAWLAKALPPDGTLISIEIDPRHAKIARKAILQMERKIEIIEGPALEILGEMIENHAAPFDLIFLDADKPSYPEYIEPMISLTRPEGLIIADNLIRRGKVIDPLPHDKHTLSLARFNEIIAAHPRLESVMLPTLVGYVGGDLDGMSLSRVLP